MAMSSDQLIALFGAFLILIAYGLQNLAPPGRFQVLYLLLNIIGSVALLLPALHSMQYGYIILQCFWILISVLALIRLKFRKVV